MLKRAHPRGRGEQGFVLILVLLFVAVVGLVTVALLRQTSTSIAAVKVATTNEARVSAVNAGIDVVIRDIESETDGSCSGASLSLNSVPVQASCSTLSGPPAPTPTVVGPDTGDDGSVITTEIEYAVYYWTINSATTDGTAKNISAEASVQYLVTSTTITVVPPPPEPTPDPDPSATPDPDPPEAPTPTVTETEAGDLTILSWAISNP
ncbi:MAG: hypothetical protein R3C39_00475 [Dehalococcoidia bacterium]